MANAIMRDFNLHRDEVNPVANSNVEDVWGIAVWSNLTRATRQQAISDCFLCNEAGIIILVVNDTGVKEKEQLFCLVQEKGSSIGLDGYVDIRDTLMGKLYKIICFHCHPWQCNPDQTVAAF